MGRCEERRISAYDGESSRASSGDAMSARLAVSAEDARLAASQSSCFAPGLTAEKSKSSHERGRTFSVPSGL